jgi:tripeptide aminopeptidase
MAAPYSSDLAAQLADDTLARLDRYARIDTQSARERTQSPSTPGQLDLSRLLVAELQELGVGDAALDDNGYVTASLPATVDGPVPAIALLAHVDVSPDAPAAGVEPLVHRDWDGGAIALPRGGTQLDPATMPELAACAGHTIITSSGDTLLGADDKAGVAEIMAAVAHLVANPELPRPALKLCFTPDEEIGEGATLVDLERLAADCAYTLDASSVGTLQDETFTAAEIVIEISGVDVHPGFATGKMVNAARLVGRVLAGLPPELSPERTADRDGFVHPYEVSGSAAHATLKLIARDFDDDKLAAHIAVVRAVAEDVVGSEPTASFTFESHAQYPNMRSYLEPFPQVVAAADRAIRAEGLKPVRTPIRGGTDGSVLSARGLPTPNVFTGGYEYHSVREWASLQEMAAATATIVRLAGVWTEDDFRGAFA